MFNFYFTKNIPNKVIKYSLGLGIKFYVIFESTSTINMKGKVVIITGAASGIGLATSRYFLEKGNRVVMADISREDLDREAKDFTNMGFEVMPLLTDVSKEEDCRILVEKTMDKYSRIDVLINNAGISMRSLFQETDLSVFRKVMNVNFWGTAYCSYHALPYLLKTRGSLVGITSVAGRHGMPGRTAYSSSKFAINGLLETIRIENIKKGLHVLTFAPGFTATNVRNHALTADGREQGASPRKEKKMMTPSQVARKIYLSVKRRKRDVVLSWEGKSTMIMKHFFLSRLVDRAYYRQLSKEPGSPF